MATTADDAVELTLLYIDELHRLADQVGLILRGTFEDMAHTNRADIAEFIAEAEPWAQAGASEAADMAAAYLSELTGTTLTATDITMPDIAFEDPFLRTWHELSEGMSYAEAKASGASSAELVGRDATRDGAASRMGQPGTAVRGWRRVISAKACEWCRVVGTQLYKTQATATFGHHGCKCEIVAVPAGADPGQAINQARLRELKASGAIERTNAARVRSRARDKGL